MGNFSKLLGIAAILVMALLVMPPPTVAQPSEQIDIVVSSTGLSADMSIDAVQTGVPALDQWIVQGPAKRLIVSTQIVMVQPGKIEVKPSLKILIEPGERNVTPDTKGHATQDSVLRV